MKDKEYFGSFTDFSERYEVTIKVLRAEKTNPLKFSMEIKAKNNPKDIRSFRSASKVDIENFIISQSSALGFFLTDMGFFRDVILSPLKHQELEIAVNDYLKVFVNKIRLAIHDGIKKYWE